MNQTQMQYFISAFEFRNISKAAEAQHVSRQALSKGLSDLESELGYQLFIRSQNGVTPTQAAINIFPHVQAIQEEYSYIYNNKTLLSMTKKEVTLCVFDSFLEYLSCTFLNDFIQKNPNILLNIESYTDREAMERLQLKQCDFAIVTDAVDMSGFEKMFLFRARYGCLINRANPLSHKEIIDIADLKGQPLIGKSRKIAYYTRDLNGLIEMGLDMSFIVEVDNSYIARKLVSANKGIALMWDYTDPKMLEGSNIVPRPIYSKNWGCDVYLLYNSNMKLSKKHHIVKESLKAWCLNKEKNWEVNE